MDDIGLIFDASLAGPLAVIAGYLAAIAVHIALSWLVTREGRGLLMQGDRMSPVFFVQLAVIWIVAGAAGVLVAVHIAGSNDIEIASAVAVLLLLTQLRNHVKLSPQQPLGVSLALLIVTGVGCTGGWVLTPMLQ